MYLGDESKLMLRAALVAFNMSVQDCYSIAQTTRTRKVMRQMASMREKSKLCLRPEEKGMFAFYSVYTIHMQICYQEKKKC